DALHVENMRVWWWKETIVEANWKVAQEAFHEGYHTMQTHPQLTMGLGVNYPMGRTEFTAFPNGHGRFRGKAFDARKGGVAQVLPADEFIYRSRILWEGQDAMILERDLQVFESIRKKIPPDQDFGTAAVAALYEYAAGAGIPMPPLGEHVRQWGC